MLFKSYINTETMKLLKIGYIFNIFINTFLFVWSLISFNDFRVDYIYYNASLPDINSKNIVFQTILISITSIMPLLSFNAFHFFSSLIVLTANLSVLYKCTESCELVLNNGRYDNIHDLTKMSLFVQIYNIINFAFYLVYCIPENKNNENNQENNQENNENDENDENKSLISRHSNSSSYIYKFYPNIND